MKLNVADRIESSAAEQRSSLSPLPLPRCDDSDSGQQPRMFGQVGSWVAAGAAAAEEAAAAVACHGANDDGPLRGTSFIEIGMGGTIKPGIARTPNERTDEGIL